LANRHNRLAFLTLAFVFFQMDEIPRTVAPWLLLVGSRAQYGVTATAICGDEKTFLTR
jgi:hypothetical protein